MRPFRPQCGASLIAFVAMMGFLCAGIETWAAGNDAGQKTTKLACCKAVKTRSCSCCGQVQKPRTEAALTTEGTPAAPCVCGAKTPAAPARKTAEPGSEQDSRDGRVLAVAIQVDHSISGRFDDELAFLAVEASSRPVLARTLRLRF